MTTIVNTKLGEIKSKGLKRIWLEGQKLAREGYRPGDRLDLSVSGKGLVANVTPSGKYTISRRKTKTGRIYPVIDLTASEIAELFDTGEKLRVAIQKGTIVITCHHQEDQVREREDRLIKKIGSGKPLDMVSLFHGGGILDRSLHDGYKRVGIKTRLAVASEIEPKYLDCSMRNNSIWDKDTLAIEGPIQDIDLRDMNQPDIVVAGLPCVGASKSGKSKNKIKYAESHPEAGALFFSTLEVIKTLNPALVWLEQVPEYLNTASWAVVASVLSSLKYKLHVQVLDSYELGSLEKRRRMCCIAVSEGLDSNFSMEDIHPIRKRESNIGEILEAVPKDSARWKKFKYLKDKEIRDKKDKKGFLRQIVTPDSDRCGTIGRLYHKYRSTEPFVPHPEDPSKSRIFIPVEHARVKTIPEELIRDEVDCTAHEILGQSVIKCAFEAAAFAHGRSLANTYITGAEKTQCAA